VNKRELIQEAATSTGLGTDEVDRALAGLIEAIRRAVAAGDRVAVPDLGTFEKRERGARAGRNPQTGEPLEIAATSVPAFKPATAFKKQVADGA
jgi:DNA-binding protein HU-beta